MKPGCSLLGGALGVLGLLIGGPVLNAAPAAPAEVAVGGRRAPAPPPPLPPIPKSPIDYFRQLLEASVPERETLLTNKSALHRGVLEKSLRIYDRLSPAEREVRLRTMELRYYFYAVLETPAESRTDRLALLPELYRQAVSNRLAYWYQLPAEVQREVQEYERLTRGLMPGAVRPNTLAPSYDEVDPRRLLPNPRRLEIQQSVNRVLEMTPVERAAALDAVAGKLPPAEREQMEQTLATFRALPKAQRDMAIRGFGKFANLSPQEQRQFLRSAQVWEKMSPTDRQKWRDIVAKLPPLPPTPAGFDHPPMPPLPRPPAPVLATNWQQ